MTVTRSTPCELAAVCCAKVWTAALRPTTSTRTPCGSGAWKADILCLVLAIKAIGQPVPWTLLVPAWAAGATASSLSPTPGGLGVVEAAPAAALVTAGLHSSAALGAVLAYRAVTFWLALGIGWTIYLLQTAPQRGTTAPNEAARTRRSARGRRHTNVIRARRHIPWSELSLRAVWGD